MATFSPMRAMILAAEFLACVLPLSVRAQTGDIKAGVWEMTYTLSVPFGGLASGIENMPSERRAKVQNAMRKNSKPQTVKKNICIMKANLAELAGGPGKNESCSYTNIKANSTSWSADTLCGNGATGHTKIDALSTERVKGKTVMKTPSGRGPGKMEMTTEGRWTSEKCKGRQR